jgi:hypothetical protein
VRADGESHIAAADPPHGPRRGSRGGVAGSDTRRLPVYGGYDPFCSIILLLVFARLVRTIPLQSKRRPSTCLSPSRTPSGNDLLAPMLLMLRHTPGWRAGAPIAAHRSCRVRV